MCIRDSIYKDSDGRNYIYASGIVGRKRGERMSNEDMASRIQVYLKKIEKIRVKRMKREKFKHLLKTLGLSAGRK